MADAVTRVAAVILAGGRGERLGGANKALLTIGGERFIDRAIAIVADCAPRLLAIGARAFNAPSELVQVLDLEGDYAGPLAGVAAAAHFLADTDCDLLLSLAVDSPLLPSDFLPRALERIGAAPAVIAAYAGQDYPTNGLWRLDALAGLPTQVLAGTAPHSLRRLSDQLGAIRLDYAQIADSDPFRNANTPEDLAFLRDVVERRGRA
jgi:molybdopterin-guanine dinucleotide biosynthesis protein A